MFFSKKEKSSYPIQHTLYVGSRERLPDIDVNEAMPQLCTIYVDGEIVHGYNTVSRCGQIESIHNFEYLGEIHTSHQGGCIGPSGWGIIGSITGGMYIAKINNYGKMGSVSEVVRIDTIGNKGEIDISKIGVIDAITNSNLMVVENVEKINQLTNLGCIIVSDVEEIGDFNNSGRIKSFNLCENETVDSFDNYGNINDFLLEGSMNCFLTSGSERVRDPCIETLKIAGSSKIGTFGDGYAQDSVGYNYLCETSKDLISRCIEHKQYPFRVRHVSIDDGAQMPFRLRNYLETLTCLQDDYALDIGLLGVGYRAIIMNTSFEDIKKRHIKSIQNECDPKENHYGWGINSGH